MAKALEPFGLYWFEEPCWPESIEGLADIQRAVATPIATGERLTSQHAFRELLEKRAASIPPMEWPTTETFAIPSESSRRREFSAMS